MAAACSNIVGWDYVILVKIKTTLATNNQKLVNLWCLKKILLWYIKMFFNPCLFWPLCESAWGRTMTWVDGFFFRSVECTTYWRYVLHRMLIPTIRCLLWLSLTHPSSYLIMYAPLTPCCCAWLCAAVPNTYLLCSKHKSNKICFF